MSEFRYFESGYFEPFFDALFEFEAVAADPGGVGFFGTFSGSFYGTFFGPVEEEEDVLRRVSGWTLPVFPRRRPRRREEELEDEEALIALLLATTR